MASAPLAPTRSRNQTQSIIWTPEEDQHLSNIMKTTPVPSWCSLLHHFPGKTAQQIAGRWEKVLNPSLIKGSWTREEDEIIVEFVKNNGPKNWVKLAESLPGRIGKQCRERWTNHLSPEVARSSWTEEEDQRLIELHNQFGNQWTVIASYMEGRTDNNVKNRWNSSLKRRIERIQRGEPAFKKRGRKPKSLQQNITPPPSPSSDVHSDCSSPEPEQVIAPHTTICVFSNRIIMSLPSFTGRLHEERKSLEQNRLNLQLLMREQMC